MLRLALGLLGKADRIAVERAIAEIRMARPVLIETSSEAALTVSIEGLDANLCAALDRVSAGRARLVLPRRGCAASGSIGAWPELSPCPSSAATIARCCWRLARASMPGSAAQLLWTRMRWSWPGFALLLPAALVIPVPPGTAMDPAVLPGFKWSSQHLERGGCDDCSEAAFGSVRARRVALAWSALCCAA